MLPLIFMSAAVCTLMIIGILFFPKIKLGKMSFDSYYVITVIGAIIIVFTYNEWSRVMNGLAGQSAINPLKILILFISMTVMSVFLDELGFFSYLAGATLKKANASQKKLFVYLYLIVSVLTVFTSNDIIILSFTPFICYFAKNAGISPIPYLAAEFTAANTWSMALIIGNPTNIYLASDSGIDFISYFRVMLLPTLAAGTVAFVMLFILFSKKLGKKMEPCGDAAVIKDRLLLAVGLFHLGGCTVALAVCSYTGVEMWIISFAAVISLFVCTLVVSAFRRTKPRELTLCLRRAPWQLIPFVLSMFSIIIVLNDTGVTDSIATLFGKDDTILKFGVLSFLSANVINNIPMSVLFCGIMKPLTDISAEMAVYSTVIGSNLGAIFTPVGALAGIMWSSILTKHHLRYSYLDFLKTGAVVGLPTLAAALTALSLEI